MRFYCPFTFVLNSEEIQRYQLFRAALLFCFNPTCPRTKVTAKWFSSLASAYCVLAWRSCQQTLGEPRHQLRRVVRGRQEGRSNLQTIHLC